jgi:glycosyltransferase involved in cell wall biosynthesis
MIPFKNRLQRMIRASAAMYRRALELKADIYHFHDPEFLPYATRLRRKGYRVIYDAHEDLPRQLSAKYYVPRFLRGPAAWMAERYENRAARRMSWIIAATDNIRDRFLKQHDRVTTVHNYPRLQDLPAVISPMAGRPREIAYVGAITRKRGLVHLVDAMQHVNGLLNLAGRFDSDNLHRELTAKPWYARKVKEWGFIGYDSTRELMSRARVGVVLFLPTASHVAALPNKLFDYMGQGLPVVASDFPDWRRIIEDHKCGICVDPLNPEAIAAALNLVLDDQEAATQMGANGRRAVMEEYNWATEESTLRGVYDTLLRT